MRVITGFELMVRELEPLLYGKEVLVSEREIRNSWSFQDKVKGIKSTPEKRHSRTDAEIEGDCLVGTAAEIGVAKLLGAQTFDEEFDLSDRSSYAKDVVYKGIRIEIKSHHHLRKFTVSDNAYSKMLKARNERLLDVIVFAHVQRISDLHFGVTPTVIVDPFHDEDIIKFTGMWEMQGRSWVYRADQAYKRDLCHPLIDLEA